MVDAKVKREVNLEHFFVPPKPVKKHSQFTPTIKALQPNIVPRRYSTAVEYILPLDDKYLQMFSSNDRRLRSVANHTNCDIFLTKRILHRRLNGAGERYCIIKITGPSSKLIEACNRMIEDIYPEFAERKLYRPTYNKLTLFANSYDADNSPLNGSFSRMGPTMDQFEGLTTVNPFQMSKHRTPENCPWKVTSADRKGFLFCDPVHLNDFLTMYCQQFTNEGPAYSPESIDRLANVLLKEANDHYNKLLNLKENESRLVDVTGPGTTMSYHLTTSKTPIYWPSNSGEEGDENERMLRESMKFDRSRLESGKYNKQAADLSGTDRESAASSSDVRIGEYGPPTNERSTPSGQQSKLMGTDSMDVSATQFIYKVVDTEANPWIAPNNKTHEEELELDQVQVTYLRTNIQEEEESVLQRFSPAEMDENENMKLSPMFSKDIDNDEINGFNLPYFVNPQSNYPRQQQLDDVWINCDHVISSTNLLLNDASMKSEPDGNYNNKQSIIGMTCSTELTRADTICSNTSNVNISLSSRQYTGRNNNSSIGSISSSSTSSNQRYIKEFRNNNGRIVRAVMSVKEASFREYCLKTNNKILLAKKTANTLQNPFVIERSSMFSDSTDDGESWKLSLSINNSNNGASSLDDGNNNNNNKVKKDNDGKKE